jgi:hypothetical protein
MILLCTTVVLLFGSGFAVAESSPGKSIFEWNSPNCDPTNENTDSPLEEKIVTQGRWARPSLASTWRGGRVNQKSSKAAPTVVIVASHVDSTKAFPTAAKGRGWTPAIVDDILANPNPFVPALPSPVQPVPPQPAVSAAPKAPKAPKAPRPWLNSPAVSAAAPVPAAPAAPAAAQAKKASLSATTAQGTTYCSKWPDNVSSEASGLRILGPNSNIEITCWAAATMPGTDPVWLKTNSGCFVNQKSLQGKADFQGQLNQCENRAHWVGTLLEQYKRQDCYDCTSLDCASRNMGQGPYMDLDCSTEGIAVAGNR